VQGVFFRDATRRKALELGLTGHAINLPDGNVEVVACGSREMIAALQQWLWQGPELANVTSVDCQPSAIQQPDGFAIG